MKCCLHFRVIGLRRCKRHAASQFGIVVLRRWRLQNSLPHWRCIRLHLPQAAADYAPQGEAFWWSFLPTIAHCYVNFCIQLHPRGTPILIGAGWRSQTIGEKGRSARAELAPDRAIQVFPCHGGAQVIRVTPSFIQSAFTATTQLSLVLSWAPRKYRTSPPPHAKTAARQYRAAAQCACVWFSSNTPWGR